jgi:general secretion pathway protein D
MTPHIIPEGEIQLELNPSIEAIVDPGPPNSQFAPTIAKRDVSTTITVGDRRTAVISGLIREDTTKVERKIPLLGSLPLIGRFFKHTRDAKQKTNLMILVTPTIIQDDEMASRVERALREKTGLKTSELTVNMENGDGER